MPHLTLEHTANLPREIASDDLFHQLHRVLVEVAGSRLDNCKSQAVEYDRFFVGDGSVDQVFVHLAVRFLAGRPEEVKREAGERMLTILRDAYEDAGTSIQITVEIHEVFWSSYFKHPAGTL